jgi:hypothetical protein
MSRSSGVKEGQTRSNIVKRFTQVKKSKYPTEGQTKSNIARDPMMPKTGKQGKIGQQGQLMSKTSPKYQKGQIS